MFDYLFQINGILILAGVNQVICLSHLSFSLLILNLGSLVAAFCDLILPRFGF